MAAERILFLEDDYDTCAMMSILLGWEGYSVAEAMSVRAAVEMIRGERFDLYILDNWLGDGSGIDVCKMIRAYDTSTPILFYSGVADPAEREKALRAGAQGYVIKPTSIESFKQIVSGLLSRSSVAA